MEKDDLEKLVTKLGNQLLTEKAEGLKILAEQMAIRDCLVIWMAEILHRPRVELLTTLEELKRQHHQDLLASLEDVDPNFAGYMDRRDPEEV